MNSKTKRLSSLLACVLALLALSQPALARLPNAELLFRSNEGALGIRSLRPRSEGSERLTRGRHEHIAWSPDRSRIAFVETGRARQPLALWVMDRDGGNETKLVDMHGDDMYRIGFGWAPDGTRIVFSDRADERSTYDLSVVEVKTGEVTRLTEGGGDEEFPDWSPDGASVIYQSAGDIYEIEVEGGATTQLTDHRKSDFEPMWSPDGASIAFFSTRNDRSGSMGPYFWELYTMDADGENEDRLTRHQTRKNGASWSPDGSAIAYSSRCDDDLCLDDYDDNIYVVDVSSRERRRLTSNGQRPESNLSWSPDSRWIAFELVLRGGRTQDLGAVRVDGERTKRLTSTPDVTEVAPVWSPR